MTSTVPTSATSAQKLVSYTHCYTLARFTVRLHFYVLGRLVKAHVVLTCTVVSLAQSPSGCGQRQTTNHIVDMCPLMKFEGGLNLLHEADDDAVIWLESTATAALAKYINRLVSHAKMAEPIEMPFCGTDSCGPKASYIGWGAHRRHLANTIE